MICSGVPPVRAPKGTSYGRPHWAVAGVAALRSALHPNRTFTTRGHYFVDRHAGVMFPAAFIQSAAYEASL